MDKLIICKQTRQFASDSLYKVLKDLLASDKPISEVTLRDAWLKEMQTNKNILPEGWYQPPPYGMIILFADENNVKRFDYKSARPKESWPREDIFLNRETGIIYCYASPVDKKSGIIGDFGITLYFGNDPDFKQLVKTCLQVNQEIFAFSATGKTLSEVSHHCETILKTHGMNNQIASITDKTATNIGHSIPAADVDWSAQEKKIIASGLTDWISAKDMISNKRFFVNTDEAFAIKPGCAFTIEPRPKVADKPNLPASASYHTIALFYKDGSKEFLTQFDDLFKLAGMEYML